MLKQPVPTSYGQQKHTKKTADWNISFVVCLGQLSTARLTIQQYVRTDEQFILFWMMMMRFCCGGRKRKKKKQEKMSFSGGSIVTPIVSNHPPPVCILEHPVVGTHEHSIQPEWCCTSQPNKER